MINKEKIKEKVREIQHNYCGEPVETKLYYAIKEGIKMGEESYPQFFDVSPSAENFDYKGEYSQSD